MKKSCFKCLFIIGCGSILIATTTRATLFTFDDLSDNGGGWTQIPNGYAGLDWNYFNVMNSADFGVASGFLNGTVSGNNVAFNPSGVEATISSGGSFT